MRRAVGAGHEEEVRGLEIAVDDVERVRLGERAARLVGEGHGLLPGELAAALAGERGDVGALQVLHHHEGRAVLQRVDVHHAHDVLAGEAERGARLAEHARGHGVVVEERRVQHLDRDELVEAEVARLEHEAHAAAAEDALDRVFAREDAIDPGGVAHRFRDGALRGGRSFLGSRRAGQAVPDYRSGRKIPRAVIL